MVEHIPAMRHVALGLAFSSHAPERARAALVTLRGRPIAHAISDGGQCSTPTSALASAVAGVLTVTGLDDSLRLLGAVLLSDPTAPMAPPLPASPEVLRAALVEILGTGQVHLADVAGCRAAWTGAGLSLPTRWYPEDLATGPLLEAGRIDHSLPTVGAREVSVRATAAGNAARLDGAQSDARRLHRARSGNRRSPGTFR